ncbi:tRNA pseudouridine synthase A, partial [Actinomyces sp. AC-20-1]
AAQCAHLDVPLAAWRAVPGRSGRCPEDALLTRLAGVLARQARLAAEAGLTGPVPRGASDVVVTGARVAPEGFDARFSALSRRYVYRIADGGPAGAPRSTTRRGQVLWLPEELDVDAMARSARPLLGEHDFLSYCRPREGATTVRTLHRLDWRRPVQGADAGLVTLTVVADAFCHSMVRSLVGAGLAVGRGSRDEGWPAALLERRSRDGAAPVAPAHGLTLEEVVYPGDDALAEQARRSRVLRRLPGEDCGC